MFYKDVTAEFANANKQPEQVSLEEISESDVVNKRQNTEVGLESDPESMSRSKPEQIVESVTPELPTRRSNRTIIAPQRYLFHCITCC